MVEKILEYYGLDPDAFHISKHGTGLINETYRVTNTTDDYILQQVNTNVFEDPQAISTNLQLIKEYLDQSSPEYLFVVPLSATDGRTMITLDDGEVFRLFPFINGSSTITEVNNEKAAFEAAKQFGKLTNLLADFEPGSLTFPLSDFHNLELRFKQFESACSSADQVRLIAAKSEIDEIYTHKSILTTYLELISKKDIPLRVIHHDTKISNVLFDKYSNGICVIDLDTLMPGYFTSDVGDMLRTYLSPVGEEEKDLSLITIRSQYFAAIYKGYMSEMGNRLMDTEKEHFYFAGQLLMYMQALRFLTDYLNNDRYYGAAYPDHNLFRAKNQINLLVKYEQAEARLKALMKL